MTGGNSAIDGFSSPLISPPTTDDDRISWVQLIRSRRIGPKSFFRLLQEHGNAGNALRHLPDIARKAGVKRYQPCSRNRAETEFIDAIQSGHRFVAFGSRNYPPYLHNTEDAPPYLWLRGSEDVLQKSMLAIVGARNASSLGMRMARYLAKDLSDSGVCIVSGLARGIDTAAHKASVENGTVAVLAGGLKQIYPVENSKLAQQICQDGALISEHPQHTAPQARHFPQRNRIIAGMCRATIVVEGAARSGSLITARLALERGRDVMAVPGSPLDGRAAGCNILIRDGAVLVRSAQDILELLASSDGTSGHCEQKT